MDYFDLVVIDGVKGGGNTGQAFQSNFDRLMGARFDVGKPIIVSTEASAADIDCSAWQTILTHSEMFTVDLDQFLLAKQSAPVHRTAPPATADTPAPTKIITDLLTDGDEIDRRFRRIWQRIRSRSQSSFSKMSPPNRLSSGHV